MRLADSPGSVDETDNSNAQRLNCVAEKHSIAWVQKERPGSSARHNSAIEAAKLAALLGKRYGRRLTSAWLAHRRLESSRYVRNRRNYWPRG